MRTTEEGEFAAGDLSGRQSGYGRLMVVAVILLIALTFWAVARRGPKAVMRAERAEKPVEDIVDNATLVLDAPAPPIKDALSAPEEPNLPQYRLVTYFDPFPLLEQQYQKALLESRLRFDSAEETASDTVRSDLDRAYKEYLVDFEALQKLPMYVVDRKARCAVLYAQYQKKALTIKDQGKADVKRIAAERQAALFKLEEDKTDRRMKLERIEAMIAQGRIDPTAAKQEQLRTLGISVSSSLLSSPGSAAEHQVRPEKEATFVGNGPPVVTAIFIGDHNRLCALAGGAFLYEGDMVNGCRVQKIHQNSVVFERDGKTWVYGVQ